MSCTLLRSACEADDILCVPTVLHMNGWMHDTRHMRMKISSRRLEPLTPDLNSQCSRFTTISRTWGRPALLHTQLGTGKVCSGSSSLQAVATFYLTWAGDSPVSVYYMYVQGRRHIIVRKPTNALREERGERRKERQHTAAIQYTD